MPIKKLVLVVSLLMYLPVVAQVTEGKNVAKVNLSAFLFKGINVQYERQVAKKLTVALGYSSIPMSTLAFEGYIKNRIDDPNVDISRFRLGTSIFTPEVRYYFSKKGAFHGFYLAPYARIGKYKLEGPVNYTTSQNADRNILLTGTLNSITGGLLAGCNFKLSNKLYLDWWIAGAGIGTAKGNYSGNTPLTPTEQTALKNELDELDIPSTTTKAEVSFTGAVVTSNGTMVGLRGFGINIGFRF